MQCLVTGGTGYLGRALAERLQNDGHRVRILDVRKGDLFCEYVEGDILVEQDVERAMRGVDAVFHVAAIVGFWKGKREWQRLVNVEGTRNVMQAALRLAVPKIVYTSTINTFGYARSETEVGDETTPYNWGPLDVSYMETKHEAQNLVIEMVRTSALPATIVNPGTVFGGAGASGMNANRYIELIRAKQMPAYPTGGTNCVALEDVVEGHVMAYRKGKPGECYILGAENLTYRALFEFIASELKVPAPAIPLVEGVTSVVAGIAEKGFSVFGKEPPFTGEMVRASSRYSFYRNDKARREFGMVFKEFLPYLQRLIQQKYR
jgi:dihydroflavonol-4-reductase